MWISFTKSFSFWLALGEAPSRDWNSKIIWKNSLNNVSMVSLSTRKYWFLKKVLLVHQHLGFWRPFRVEKNAYKKDMGVPGEQSSSDPFVWFSWQDSVRSSRLSGRPRGCSTWGCAWPSWSPALRSRFPMVLIFWREVRHSLRHHWNNLGPWTSKKMKFEVNLIMP